MDLDRLNAMSDSEALDFFLSCCGARRWAMRMLAARPFDDEGAMMRAAELSADALGREDWLEAFAHHPRIGDVSRLRERFGASAHFSANEQSGVASATEATLQRLHRMNVAYEEKFGHVFLICATGKSAGEMLEALEVRFANDPEGELANAAAEQRKITAIRLRQA